MRFLILAFFIQTGIAYGQTNASCRTACDRAQAGADFICSSGDNETEDSGKNMDSKDLRDGRNIYGRLSQGNSALILAKDIRSLSLRDDAISRAASAISETKAYAAQLCRKARDKALKSCPEPCHCTHCAGYLTQADELDAGAKQMTDLKVSSSIQADDARSLSSISENTLKPDPVSAGQPMMEDMGKSSCVGFEECIIKEGTHSPNIEDRRNDSNSYVVPAGWDQGGVEN